MVKILLEAINEATERKKNILVSLKHVGIASLSVLGEWLYRWSELLSKQLALTNLIIPNSSVKLIQELWWRSIHYGLLRKEK